jgi:hypothetical protein
LVEVDHLLSAPGVAHADPTHVLIDVGPLGITGHHAGDFIRDEHQIDVKLVDYRQLMALVTFRGTTRTWPIGCSPPRRDLTTKSARRAANETPEFPAAAALADRAGDAPARRVLRGNPEDRRG